MKQYTGEIVFKAEAGGSVYWIEKPETIQGGEWTADRRKAKRYPAPKRWDILTQQRNNPKLSPENLQLWLMATSVRMTVTRFVDRPYLDP